VETAQNSQKQLVIDKTGHGRLAQLVERNIDVVDVRGSNPLPPTVIVRSTVIGG
jgi:hypothetical protein